MSFVFINITTIEFNDNQQSLPFPYLHSGKFNFIIIILSPLRDGRAKIAKSKASEQECKGKKETQIIINLGDEDEEACKVKVCTYQKGDGP